MKILKMFERISTNINLLEWIFLHKVTFQFKIQKKKFPAQTNSYFIEYETRILPRIKLRISKADLNLFAAEFQIRKIKSLYHRQAGILNQPSGPADWWSDPHTSSVSHHLLCRYWWDRDRMCAGWFAGCPGYIALLTPLF